MPRPSPLRLAALAALAALGAARPAAADPAALPIRIGVSNGRAVASVDLGEAFPPAAERRLGNGLRNVVAVYVSVVPRGGRQPVAIHGRVVDVLFDVWEEHWSVTVKDPRTPQGRRAVLEDYAALRRLLAQPRDVDLGPVGALPAGFVVEARVEVNPVSRELLQRTREFIANPAAGARGTGSRSVLGAMASFLLREPDAGEDVHRFRSRVFEAGEVAPR